MEFLLNELSKMPALQLVPDRPAAKHRLSYEEMKYEQSVGKSRQSQQAEHLQNIDRLSEVARLTETKAKKQQQKHLQSILLLHLEINRLRQIICEIDGELRRVGTESQSIENIYKLKLEDMKMTLIKSFESEKEQLADKIKKDLSDMKDLYASKIGLIVQESKAKEDDVSRQEMQIHDQAIKIKIYELKSFENDNRILSQNKIIAQLEKKVYQQEESISQTEKQFITKIKDNASQIEFLKKRNSDQEITIQELENHFQDFKTNIEDLYRSNERLERENAEKKEEIEKVLLKNLVLEKQIDGFRNRKTQGIHNIFPREQDRYPTNNMDHRESLSKKPFNQPNLSQRNETQKNQENFNYIAEISELKDLIKSKDLDIERKEAKINELFAELEKKSEKKECVSQELQRKLDKKDSQLKELQNRIEKKDNQIRDLNGEVSSIQKKSQERLNFYEKELEQMQGSWDLKEKEMNALFKSIDNKYMKQLGQMKEELVRKDEEAQTMIMMVQEKTRQCAEYEMKLSKKK